MSKKQPQKVKEPPPSQMIRVPTPLIDAVKELSRLHRQGRTAKVLKGLEQLISAIDLENDINIGASSEVVKQLVQRIDSLESRFGNGDFDSNVIAKSSRDLEQRLETISNRLTQLETAFVRFQNGRMTSRRQYSPHFDDSQLQSQLQSMSEENLARRLGVDAVTLAKERTTCSTEDFLRWCRSRDPGRLGWQYNSQLNLYQPVR
ncbi:Hpt domain-containing protein [Nostoc sp. NIES-3756]|uniref:Hpt domain-containing protein n=1 Tax=Nostoc sp. NIES-3756 TaxID=1751286 RepID=UPI001E554C14|nr:Hpt domain-containing protein [Nostoc sp. NIES-3756]